MKDIKILDSFVGPTHPPFVIAEMSGNHNQSLERALSIVDAAAQAGASALKIQTYTADTMTIDVSEGEFFVDNPKSLWYGSSLYKLYQQATTPWEWHKPIFDRCRQKGLIPFSTPFDASAVDFLESLHVPLYKIASLENIDIPLIRKVAATGKPVIISSALATKEELDESVEAAREAGCKDLILLKCSCVYPAPAESANLRTIQDMQEHFKVQVGLSDHTLGIGVAVASVAVGATVIEKHFTLNRKDGGVDAAFSAEPAELKRLVEECRHAWQAMGRVQYGPDDFDRESLKYRRSLYIVKDMKAGEKFSMTNIQAIRPGRGLPPKYMDKILGKTLKKDARRGTPLSLDLVK